MRFIIIEVTFISHHIPSLKGSSPRETLSKPTIIKPSTRPLSPGSGNSSGSQSLPPRGALGIEIGLLAQTHSPRPGALTQAVEEVVGRGGVVDAAVVPDGEVVGALPAVPHLQVVVLHDQPHEPIQEPARLFVR